MGKPMKDTQEALGMMVKGQLATNGIHDPRVVEALASVDRAKFVPESLRHVAFVDDDIKLCNGRFLLEPLTFARMLVHADIQRHHTVLDIGTGLGYSSAVLAYLTEDVVATEESAELVTAARKKFAAANIRHIDLVTAPLSVGCSAHKPYDRILIEGALDKIPPALEEQLGEGGKLIGIRADHGAFATQKVLGHIIVGTKHHNVMTYVEKERVSAYPLHQTGYEPFSF
jgi:protein-L-isoaspartate(D-aspartate) O-methyltransferase